METPSRELQPRLDDRPFFESHTHCESWVDQAMLTHEIQEFPGVNEEYVAKAKSDLEYAKKILSQGIFPPQNEIDTRFGPLTREIMENEEGWGEFGRLYAEIWNYLARKMAAENQE